MRATHQLLDHPRILEDAVAVRLIGADQEAALRANPQVLDRPELRPLRVSIAVRSRYAEDSLREAVRRGVRQYVIPARMGVLFLCCSERRLARCSQPAT